MFKAKYMINQDRTVGINEEHKVKRGMLLSRKLTLGDLFCVADLKCCADALDGKEILSPMHIPETLKMPWRVGIKINRPTDRLFKKHCLYRHYSEHGVLLYVGISLNVLSRLSAHKAVSDWFDEISTVKIERFYNRNEARQAETRAIKKEFPLYNIVHSQLSNV